MQRQSAGIRFRGLPGFSKLFVDWIEGSYAVRDFIPFRPEIAALRERAHDLQDGSFLRSKIHRLLMFQAESQNAGTLALKNIKRLLLADSVVVLASIAPAFAGGPLELLLKCFTTAKLAVELECIGIPAIPLCWLNHDAERQQASTSVTMLDQEARPYKLDSVASGEGYDWLIQDTIEECYRRMESSLGLSAGDTVLQELKRAYAPGTPFSLASARFISSLVREWGIVLLDPRSSEFGPIALHRLERPPFSAENAADLVASQERLLRKAGYMPATYPDHGPVSDPRENPPRGNPDLPASCSKALSSGPMALLMLEAALPVAGHVVDSCEIEGYAVTQPLFKNHGLRPPMIWPRASATIFDSRSLKTLQKYGISLAELISDKSKVLRNLTRSGSSQEVLSRFEELDKLITERLAQIGTAAASEASVKELAHDARSRMLFQLGKLRERYEAAVALRQEVIARHLERASGVLAPEGRLQEGVIAGLHFILHNSSDFSRALYDNLDIQALEHQLISAG